MTDPIDAVLFDFTGTLFAIEDAEHALAAALGPQFVHWAPQLRRLGAINGSNTPSNLPAHLAAVWERRDLAAHAHRAAYSGLSRYAGLTQAQADAVYERGISAAAWMPYPDTVEVLRRLRAHRIPTAIVSNIGWNPRPVLAAYGVQDLIDVLVLSDERGVVKPDPAIFAMACAELDADPHRVLMIGDNPDADGAATRIGCRFAYVPPLPPEQRPDALLGAIRSFEPGR